MKTRADVDGTLVRLVVQEQALLAPPDWTALAELTGPPAGRAPLVALDLSRVEFVSGRFLESCVALAQRLAEGERTLVLIGLTQVQRDVLTAIKDGPRLTVLRDAEELDARAADLLPGPAGAATGLKSAEKNILWS